MIRIPLWFLAWPRRAKQASVLLVDALLCALTLWIAMCLRLDDWVPWSGALLGLAAASVLLALPVFLRFGLYRAIFRYAGLGAFMAIGQAMLVYTVLFAPLVGGLGLEGVPRSVGLIQPLLLLVLVGGSRAGVRFWLGGLSRGALGRMGLEKVLIYGAGSAGRQLAAALANSTELRVMGYVDDDDRLHGHVLNGVRIYGLGLVGTCPTRLPSLVQRSDPLQRVRMKDFA